MINNTTLRVGIIAAAVSVVAAVAASAAPPGPSGGGGKAFTACMRAHGLPDFPDTAFSSDGLVSLEVKGEDVDVRSATYGAAVRACEPLLPHGVRPPGAPAAPAAPAAPVRP
ncbi:hypothetical protein [Nonomuraea rhodomycinica]|uniref:Uncharacterized protein n=1 Tax=Nonomuraea rhodomycinica TaxID=1712872 RepID=A0A7Y6IRS8_9ACTN|nr:hypothetical protein [Nonomuraea rhodomycinica]NUW43212.1 hypothetical protein [Nonomuraea rhodomycinica]